MISIYLLSGLGRPPTRVGAEVSPRPVWATGIGAVALTSLAGLAAYGILFGKAEERTLSAQGHFVAWERARRKRLFEDKELIEAKVAIEREEFAQKLADFRRNNPGGR